MKTYGITDFASLKVAANSMRMECILEDGPEDGICLRPMEFDENGVREVLCAPDPYEYRMVLSDLLLSIWHGPRIDQECPYGWFVESVRKNNAHLS